MNDLISRQVVLKGISLSCTGQSDVIKAEAALVRYVEKIPSAEPEPLTDEEKRIFLAAMAREEKECRKVHAEWSEGDLECELNLVDVCHEIERKVKDALWGI